MRRLQHSKRMQLRLYRQSGGVAGGKMKLLKLCKKYFKLLLQKENGIGLRSC